MNFQTTYVGLFSSQVIQVIVTCYTAKVIFQDRNDDRFGSGKAVCFEAKLNFHILFISVLHFKKLKHYPCCFRQNFNSNSSFSSVCNLESRNYDIQTRMPNITTRVCTLESLTFGLLKLSVPNSIILLVFMTVLLELTYDSFANRISYQNCNVNFHINFRYSCLLYEL